MSIFLLKYQISKQPRQHFRLVQMLLLTKNLQTSQPHIPCHVPTMKHPQNYNERRKDKWNQPQFTVTWTASTKRQEHLSKTDKTERRIPPHHHTSCQTHTSYTHFCIELKPMYTASLGQSIETSLPSSSSSSSSFVTEMRTSLMNSPLSISFMRCCSSRLSCWHSAFCSRRLPRPLRFWTQKVAKWVQNNPARSTCLLPKCKTHTGIIIMQTSASR